MRIHERISGKFVRVKHYLCMVNLGGSRDGQEFIGVGKWVSEKTGVTMHDTYYLNIFILNGYTIQ